MPDLSPDTLAIIRAIQDVDSRRRDSEERHHAENKRRIDCIVEAQRQIQSELKDISNGFPDGDPDSHRRYHESVIEWRELRNKMVREALIKAAQVGGLGAIGWIAYALWSAFKMEVMK